MRVGTRQLQVLRLLYIHRLLTAVHIHALDFETAHPAHLGLGRQEINIDTNSVSCNDCHVRKSKPSSGPIKRSFSTS